MTQDATDVESAPAEHRKPFLVRPYRIIAAIGGAIAAVISLVLGYLQVAYSPGWFPFNRPAAVQSVAPSRSADPASNGASPNTAPSTGTNMSTGTGTQSTAGNGGPPVGQVDPTRTNRPASPNPPASVGPRVTYTISAKWTYTLRDRETLQFRGNSKPDKGAAGAWGSVIYSDTDHQLNYWHITDTGPVDVASWQTCAANAKTYDAIHLDGVDTAHAFCRPESVVDGDPRIVSYVRVTDASHISDNPPSVSVEVWFVTASG